MQRGTDDELLQGTLIAYADAGTAEADRYKLDHNKQYKGHDEEVDDGVDELADLDAGAAQTNDHIGKICLEEQADQRVDDVLHQRGDDGGEGTADDNAHCHVQHIAAHGKCLKLFKELFDAAFFLFHR